MKVLYPLPSPELVLDLSFLEGKISTISFSDPELPPTDLAALPAYVKSVIEQLERFCTGQIKQFSLPHHVPEVTPFQARVLALVSKIPYGETRTYSELSAELGSSPRAVGNACRINPLPLIIPCHRVVAKQGLGGYAGRLASRIAFKAWLLELEQANKQN